MADILIVGTNQPLPWARGFKHAVFTNANTGYIFYQASSTGLSYSKTTDGGESWSSVIAVDTPTTLTAFSVWYDRWTSGDTGTKIHIWWFDSSLNTLYYRYLDTTTDSFGTRISIKTQIVSPNLQAYVSGTKAIGGNLYCVYNPGFSTGGFFRSTDSGVTWTTRASIDEAGTSDYCLLLPANAADTQDIWGVYFDSSANQITVKTYDDSANTVSESSGFTHNDRTPSDGESQHAFSASIRHSDGNAIIASTTAFQPPGGFDVSYDLEVREWNGATFTSLANIANASHSYYMSVFVDQRTEDLYVMYAGKSDGSEAVRTSSNIYYAKSTNDGTSWTVDIPYSETGLSTNKSTDTPLMGDRFIGFWPASGGGNLRTNVVNSINLSTLFTDSGNITITGNNVILSKNIEFDTGLYAITGTTARLKRGFKIATANGSYTITGTNVTVLRDITFNIDTNEVIIAGIPAELLLTEIPTAEVLIFDMRRRARR